MAGDRVDRNGRPGLLAVAESEGLFPPLMLKGRSTGASEEPDRLCGVFSASTMEGRAIQALRGASSSGQMPTVAPSGSKRVRCIEAATCDSSGR